MKSSLLVLATLACANAAAIDLLSAVWSYGVCLPGKCLMINGRRGSIPDPNFACRYRRDSVSTYQRLSGLLRGSAVLAREPAWRCVDRVLLYSAWEEDGVKWITGFLIMIDDFFSKLGDLGVRLSWC
jgi:hypothetical protein